MIKLRSRYKPTVSYAANLDEKQLDCCAFLAWNRGIQKLLAETFREKIWHF